MAHEEVEKAGYENKFGVSEGVKRKERVRRR